MRQNNGVPVVGLPQFLGWCMAGTSAQVANPDHVLKEAKVSPTVWRCRGAMHKFK